MPNERRESRADWDALVGLGLPLVGGAEAVEPSPERLVRELRLALAELSHVGDADGRERREDAVNAMLFALQQHFPTFYRRHLAGTAPADPSGRVIKLARVATRNLARYL